MGASYRSRPILVFATSKCTSNFEVPQITNKRAPPPLRTLERAQEDASRFGGQKKAVRRGDKDSHFVGYTYKRKPTVNTRPSLAGGVLFGTRSGGGGSLGKGAGERGDGDGGSGGGRGRSHGDCRRRSGSGGRQGHSDQREDEPLKREVE